MKTNYPSNVANIPTWARNNDLTLAEARTRFAQYAVLEAIASSNDLQRMLVFKGGNALDFIWQPNRSTRDLDFSFDHASSLEALNEKRLVVLFEPGLRAATRSTRLMLRIGTVKRRPPGEEKTFTTYRVVVHYAFPDQTRNYRLMELDPEYRSPAVIPVDVSTYEPICAVQNIQLYGGRMIRVCTLDDIVAEKMRSLLQQPVRNRSRRQDLLDIAVIRVEEKPLDLALVRSFLIRKADAVGVQVSRAAFYNPEIRERARQDYDLLEQTVRTRFIPFGDALGIVYALVEDLDLPDEGDQAPKSL